MSYTTSNSVYGGYYGSSRAPTSSIVNPYSGSSSIGSNVRSQTSMAPKGLDNLGNTCYISSVLQVLFLILEEKDLTITSKSQQKITRLFFILKNTRDRDDYKLLKQALEDRIDIVRGWDQQDAHELMMRMLDEMGKQNPLSLKSGKIDLSYDEKDDYDKNWRKFVSQMTKIENNKISVPFQGEILKQFTCSYNHQKHNFQRFMDLSLNLPKKQTYSYYSSSYSQPIPIKKLLDNYLGQQTIEDLQCQKCKMKRTFKKVSIVYSAPKYLIMHLSRFSKGWYDNEKDQREVQFDENLEIFQKNGKGKAYFRLLGAIHHVGTMNRGHYYAWVRLGNNWYQVNDEKVYSEQVKSKGNVSSSVYLLIYVKQKI